MSLSDGALPGSASVAGHALASGAGVLLVLMTTPNGLLGALVAARDAGLRSVARRRGIEALSVHRSGDATDPDEAAA